MSLPPEIPQTANGLHAQQEAANQLEEVQREMTGFERATLRWAKVAVCMSAVAAIFVCLQWWEMHEGGIDTHTLAEAAKEQADTARQLTIAQDAAVIFPMIDFDGNGFLNVGLVNRGKVLATDGLVTGTAVKVSLPEIKEIGESQSFSYKFPAIRIDDASNKTVVIHGYGKTDFESFVGGQVGFRVDISWRYKNGFDDAPKTDSACYIRLQMGNAPNNLSCDNARSYFLSLLPPEKRWEKAHGQNPN